LPVILSFSVNQEINHPLAEVHLLWIFHQVHHSSELFELPVGVRQSVVELLYDFVNINFTKVATEYLSILMV